MENLFDLYFDGSEYPEYRPGALGWNKQTFEKKVGNIATVIAAMKVEIIGLCEVENVNALEALQNELKRRGAEYPHRAIANLPNRAITCPALLSRFPITATNNIGAGNNGPVKRNILEADIDCGNGATLKLFVNHWPSKTHPESQRLAMAETLAKRIGQLPPGTLYVILGDLNSDYDEWRKFRTEGLDDTRGLTGLNHVLRTLRGSGLSYVNKEELAACADSGCSGRHYDLWLDLPERERGSRSYHGVPETPDHILLPPALFGRGGISYVDKSFSVFTMNGELLRNGEPFGWQMRGFGKRRVHAGEGYSDHLPIIARFIRKQFSFVAPPGGDSSNLQQQAQDSSGSGGFESSMEGWLSCGKAIELSRDTVQPCSGRYCLCMRGDAPTKNCCAGRAVLRTERVNRSRWTTVSFDLRGSGKLSVRLRAGRGKWRYYNGTTFKGSASARYLPVEFPSWKHVVLSFTYDNLSSPDLAIEFRAGANMPFCFSIDNVTVR